MRTWRALIVAILVGIATMTPAHADTVYAYWSYWQGDSGTWKYATTGPATATAVDGAVDGWRFTLGSDGRAAHPVPAADFASVCGGTAKPSGSVRVAIVIDYGTAAQIAPVAQCAIVDEGLSRASALSAVATLRFNNGFICGINDIPKSGCGDAVESPAPTNPAPSTPAASPRASARPSTSVTPMESAADVSSGVGATATADATTRPTIEPSSSSSTAATETAGETPTTSPLATVVTMLLAGIVLALALRNARRQRGGR